MSSVKAQKDDRLTQAAVDEDELKEKEERKAQARVRKLEEERREQAERLNAWKVRKTWYFVLLGARQLLITGVVKGHLCEFLLGHFKEHQGNDDQGLGSKCFRFLSICCEYVVAGLVKLSIVQPLHIIQNLNKKERMNMCIIDRFRRN